MTQAELFVGLKIPDTTAITAFHTIEKMGCKEIKRLKREIYYKFEIDCDNEKFLKKISKVDILVNANKNKCAAHLEKEESAVHILVIDNDDRCEGLLHSLQKRLGLSEIKSMEKGVLWALYFDSEIDSEKSAAIAEDIAKNLLCNENYQSYRIVR